MQIDCFSVDAHNMLTLLEKQMFPRVLIATFLLFMSCSYGFGSGENEQTPNADRGKKALTTRSFNSSAWTLNAYENAWRFWNEENKTKPANYKQAFRERYGLHPAPFDNGDYPMGLREGTMLFSKGVTSDCMICHGGSIMGKSYIGLGNASLDLQALWQDMNRASGKSGKLPLPFSHMRGTTEAGSFAVFLLAFRQPNLNVRLKPLDLDLRDHLCEDVPAWWLLKKKKTMYHTGGTPAKSVRSIMQFMLASTFGRNRFEKDEATFRDIHAFILSLEAPKYPFPIDMPLANKGAKIFKNTCARCHGSYREKWTYPNKIVPLETIGTDTTRYHGISEKWGEYYNKSWFGDKHKAQSTAGYQAPPLDGVWATAPYLHNGSAPTLYHVLNSKQRPSVFTRSFQTNERDYDKVKVGWKIRAVSDKDTVDLSPFERRKIYDTRLPGRGNQGHTFGDNLGDAERRAVIEYLKTL